MHCCTLVSNVADRQFATSQFQHILASMLLIRWTGTRFLATSGIRQEATLVSVLQH